MAFSDYNPFTGALGSLGQASGLGMSSTEYASLYNGFYNQSQQYTPWAATISNVRSDTITITPYPIKSDPTNADWLDDEINRYRTKLS